MSEDEIKPCPFCGVVPEQYRDRQFEDWVIYCGNDDCPIEVDVRDSEPAQAITAWNTRAGEQAAYERGKAEERARIAARLNARKQTGAITAERARKDGRSQSAIVAGVEVQILDEAIAIVNQE